MSKETGKFKGPVQSMYDPMHDKAMLGDAKKDGGVNHLMKAKLTIAQRQVDPHSHTFVSVHSRTA